MIKRHRIANLCDSDCNKVAIHLVTEFDIPLRYMPRIVLDDRKTAKLQSICWYRVFDSYKLDALEGSDEEGSDEEGSDEDLGPKSAAKLT